MAITLDEVKGWLDTQNLTYQESENHDAAVHLSFSDEEFNGYLKIELEEDGELIQFYCNQIIDDEMLKIKEHKHKFLVLQYLFDRNYQEKFGTWEVDPTDGEVRFAVEIPLEDNTLTEKQFLRILNRAVGTQENFEEIHKILETGEVPASESEAAALLEELLEILKEQEARNVTLSEDGI